MSVDLWLLFSFDEKKYSIEHVTKRRKKEFLVNANDEMKYGYISLVIIIKTIRLIIQTLIEIYFEFRKK